MPKTSHTFLLGFLWIGHLTTLSAQSFEHPEDSTAASTGALVISSVSPADSTLSAAAFLRGETREARLQWLRRKAFVESILSQSAHDLSDSVMMMSFALTAGALALTPEQLAQIPPATDPIGARLQQENLGIPSLLNVGNLIGQALKSLAGQSGGGQNPPELWTAIPTETEARVMNSLWAARAATSSEVYSHLDSVALTFKDLQTVLDNMVARGLVEREQISPKSEFTILGAFAIEMSRKNAKNREYVYRPRTSRRMFYTFVDALAFSRHSSLKSEDIALRDHLSRLLMLMAPNGLQN